MKGDTGLSLWYPAYRSLRMYHAKLKRDETGCLEACKFDTIGQNASLTCIVLLFQ